MKFVIGIALLAFFIWGEIELEKEERECVQREGAYPSHEGWD